mmetsp:Transcript_23791/g.58334  ORF Transcript_23791/g.58334 Transcript_23791/m.58334 type:complete len:391 (+) Transcript_23791:411-1583(+)
MDWGVRGRVRHEVDWQRRQDVAANQCAHLRPRRGQRHRLHGAHHRRRRRRQAVRHRDRLHAVREGRDAERAAAELPPAGHGNGRGVPDLTGRPVHHSAGVRVRAGRTEAPQAQVLLRPAQVRDGRAAGGQGERPRHLHRRQGAVRRELRADVLRGETDWGVSGEHRPGQARLRVPPAQQRDERERDAAVAGGPVRQRGAHRGVQPRLRLHGGRAHHAGAHHGDRRDLSVAGVLRVFLRRLSGPRAARVVHRRGRGGADADAAPAPDAHAHAHATPRGRGAAILRRWATVPAAGWCPHGTHVWESVSRPAAAVRSTRIRSTRVELWAVRAARHGSARHGAAATSPQPLRAPSAPRPGPVPAGAAAASVRALHAPREIESSSVNFILYVVLL